MPKNQNHAASPDLDSLVRQPQFLTFYYPLKERHSGETPKINFTPSRFEGFDICSIRIRSDAVSFLLNAAGDIDMRLNLDYFNDKYLPAISSARRKINVEDCTIPVIRLTQWDSKTAAGTYSVCLQFEKTGEARVSDFWKDIQSKAAGGNWLETWIRLNSLYRQCLPEQDRFSEALFYLETLQSHAAGNGSSKYREYEGTLKTGSLKPFQGTKLVIDDPRLAKLKETEGNVLMYPRDIREAVLLEPQFYKAILQAEREQKADTSQLSVQADSEDLIFAEWLR